MHGTGWTPWNLVQRLQAVTNQSMCENLAFGFISNPVTVPVAKGDTSISRNSPKPESTGRFNFV
jgi:hypothetical protein